MNSIQVAVLLEAEIDHFYTALSRVKETMPESFFDDGVDVPILQPLYDTLECMYGHVLELRKDAEDEKPT